MYWTELNLQSAEPVVDNMLYISFIKSFVITPFKNLQLVPLPMNIGVVGHELAHRVFNVKALSNEGISPIFATWNLQPFNLLKSLDEGLADFHGFSVTCDQPAGCRPNFLDVSIENSRTSAFRNVARTDACLDAPLRTSFQSRMPQEWVSSEDMYKVGNIIAASLYQAGNKAGKIEVLQKALIRAYDDESTMTPGLRQLISGNLTGENAARNFTPEAVVDIIAAHVTDPQLKRLVCSEFSTRLQLRCGSWPCRPDGESTPDLMPNCPSTASRDNTICPLLPQP
jgi:hypothetical protein